MGLSLWIVPESKVSRKLETIMNICPAEFKVVLTPQSYPKFHPHITLASLPLSMETDLDVIEGSISTTEVPLTCEFAAVETGSHYYRSVYIKIKLSSQLIGLHKHVHEALHLEPRTLAFPHLSLCYIDDIDAVNGERKRYYIALKDTGKMQDARENSESQGVSLLCGDEGDAEWLGQFVAHEIWAVRCEGPVESWVVLRKFGISCS